MPYYGSLYNTNPLLQQGMVPQMQPSFWQAQPQVLPQLQQPVDKIIRVNSPESALQFPLPPNSTSDPMFDNNGKQFYIVTTDGACSKTLETFDYWPHVEEPKTSQPDMSSYVTRSEFDMLVAMVNKMNGDTNGIHGQVQPAATASPDTAGSVVQSSTPAI